MGLNWGGGGDILNVFHYAENLAAEWYAEGSIEDADKMIQIIEVLLSMSGPDACNTA